MYELSINNKVINNIMALLMTKNLAKGFSLGRQKQKPGFYSSIQYECIKSNTSLIFVGHEICK